MVKNIFDAHSPGDIEQRLARAEGAVARLRATSFAQRAQWMRATADLLESELEQIAPVLTSEMGKTIVSARAEVTRCVKDMRFYADNAEHVLTDEPLTDPTVVGATRAFARYEPLDVVLAVMP